MLLFRMISEIKVNRMSINPIAVDIRTGKYVQSIMSNVVKVTDTSKYKMKNLQNKSFHKEDPKVFIIIKSCQSVSKTDKVVPKSVVPSKGRNETLKLLENLITRVGYVDVTANKNTNVINCNGLYIEGKMYPDYVVKCETDSLDVILLKVTEMHERITENCKKVKAFECNICEFSYMTIEEFYSHLKFKHSTDRIKFMNIEFLSRIALIVSKHQAAKVFKIQCPKCEIRFQNSIILKQHRMRTNFQCMKCKRDYNDCLNWKEHMIVCDGKGQVICDCGLEFSNYTYYEKHKTSCKQSKPKAYLCVICQSYFENTQNLIKHQKLFHPEQLEHKIKFPVSTCWTCNIKYVGSKELHNCKNVSKANYKCPLSLTVFDSEMLRDNHLNGKETSDTSCAICKKQYITNYGDSMHVCDEYISSVKFNCKISNKSHANLNEMCKHVKLSHMKYFSSVNDHESVCFTKVNQIGNLKFKGTPLLGEKTLNECRSSDVNKIEECTEMSPKTYAKKEIVINKTRAKNNKDYLVKKKRNLEETIDIKEEEIDGLTVEDFTKEGEEKRKRLQKAINNSIKERIENFNIENPQISHYLKERLNHVYLEKMEKKDSIQREQSSACNNRNNPKTSICLGETIREVYNFDNKESSILLEVKSGMHTRPLNECIDDDLVKVQNDLTKDINLKKEEIDDINTEEGFIREKEFIGSQEAMSNLNKEGISEHASQVFHYANKQLNCVHSEILSDVYDIKKKKNGTFVQETDPGKATEINTIDGKLNSTIISSSTEKNTQIATTATWKEETVTFEEQNAHPLQNSNTNEKLNRHKSSLVEVKNEIKTEPLEEYSEHDMLIISNEYFQELQMARDIIGNTEIKTESNSTPLEEELSIDDEYTDLSKSPKVVKNKQNMSECVISDSEISEIHETFISEKGSFLGQKWKTYLDAKYTHLKAKPKCMDSNFIVQKYTCTLCMKPFNGLVPYYNHYIYHSLNKHQCPYCKVLINKNFYLHCFTHVMLNYHKSVAIDESIKMVCKQCKEEVQKQYLLSHYEHHSLINIEPRIVDFPKSLLGTVLEDLRRKEKLCVLCEKNFKDLKRHLIEHLYADARADKDENGGLLCQICSKLLHNKCIYKKHVLQHASSTIYECKVCKKIYKGRACFINHQKKHVSACVQCDNCEGKFTSKQDLIHHLRKKRQTKKLIRCEICKTTFRSESLLDNHIKLFHEKDEVFPSIGQMKKPLITYSRSPKSKKSRVLHEMAASPKEAVIRECSVLLKRCDLPIEGPENVENSVPAESHWVLPKQATTTKPSDPHNNVQDHSPVLLPGTSFRKNATPMSRATSAIQTDTRAKVEGYYYEDNYKELVGSNSSLVLNMNTVDNADEGTLPERTCTSMASQKEGRCMSSVKPLAERDRRTDTSNAKYVLHKCEHCEYVTNRKTQLMKHVRRHMDGKLYSCDQCEYSAFSLCNLQKHIRKHKSEKPHSCEYCAYSAYDCSSLQIHTRRHTNEKPYSCDRCEYRASQLSYLQRHMRRHTGEKPYSCDKCDYRASHLHHLQRHMRRHTGEKPYSCDRCEYNASQLGNLQRHIIRRHGRKTV